MAAGEREGTTKARRSDAISVVLGRGGLVLWFWGGEKQARASVSRHACVVVSSRRPRKPRATEGCCPEIDSINHTHTRNRSIPGDSHVRHTNKRCKNREAAPRKDKNLKAFNLFRPTAWAFLGRSRNFNRLLPS